MAKTHAAENPATIDHSKIEVWGVFNMGEMTVLEMARAVLLMAAIMDSQLLWWNQQINC